MSGSGSASNTGSTPRSNTQQNYTLILLEAERRMQATTLDAARRRERNRQHRERNIDREDLRRWDAAFNGEDNAWSEAIPREYERIRPGRARPRSPAVRERSVSSTRSNGGREDAERAPNVYSSYMQRPRSRYDCRGCENRG